MVRSPACSHPHRTRNFKYDQNKRIHIEWERVKRTRAPIAFSTNAPANKRMHVCFGFSFFSFHSFALLLLFLLLLLFAIVLRGIVLLFFIISIRFLNVDVDVMIKRKAMCTRRRDKVSVCERKIESRQMHNDDSKSMPKGAEEDEWCYTHDLCVDLHSSHTQSTTIFG